MHPSLDIDVVRSSGQVEPGLVTQRHVVVAGFVVAERDAADRDVEVARGVREQRLVPSRDVFAAGGVDLQRMKAGPPSLPV